MSSKLLVIVALALLLSIGLFLAQALFARPDQMVKRIPTDCYSVLDDSHLSLDRTTNTFEPHSARGYPGSSETADRYSCEPADASKLNGDSQLLRGYYATGFEAPSFQPCDSRETWWVSGAMVELDIAHRRIVGSATPNDKVKPIYVELMGEVSDLGGYGHFGMSDREMKVDSLVVADRVYETDRQCKPIGNWRPSIVINREKNYE